MRRVFMALLGIIILIPMAASFAGECGDVDNDNNINILDIVYLINYIYKNGPDPVCMPNVGTVTDIDGNVYYTVKIGEQWWMMENLKVTHYSNGDPIPNVTGDTEWLNLTTGAYCNYENDEGYVATYGRLYNWFAVVDGRNIAPTGWHVPSDAEWQTLVDYLGGDAVAGGEMKEIGTTHWIDPNTGATNGSGFCGLPGGSRRNDGFYGYMGGYGEFWTTTEYSSTNAWDRTLRYDDAVLGHDWLYRFKQVGVSVRCVRD